MKKWFYTEINENYEKPPLETTVLKALKTTTATWLRFLSCLSWFNHLPKLSSNIYDWLMTENPVTEVFIFLLENNC